MLSRRSRSGDSWRGLRRQGEAEALQEEFLVGLGLGIPAQDQRSAVGGWEVDVEHVDGGKLVEHRPRGEAGSQRPEPGAQRDVQTIGEEGHEDVRLNALLQLVMDRP